MQTKLRRCLLAAMMAGAFAAGEAQAWGQNGHRAVGAIADQLLRGSNAEARLKALLLPGETLESISVWADSAKCRPNSGNGRPCTLTPEMAAYTAANPRHEEYHYTDIPFQHDDYHDGAVGSFDHDIVHTMAQAINVLQGRADPVSNPQGFTPRQALLILAHMVGDLMQPLHVGSPYLDKQGRFVAPAERKQIDAVNVIDLRGGNDLLVEVDWYPAPGTDGPVEKRNRPLHSYWDGTLVDYAMKRIMVKTPAEFAQTALKDKPPVAPTQGEVATWPYQWATETLHVSKRAYAGVVPGAAVPQPARDGGEARMAWKVALPENYAAPASQIAAEQLVKGGYRLAQLLQRVLN